jgi:hypothetical protein
VRRHREEVTEQLVRPVDQIHVHGPTIRGKPDLLWPLQGGSMATAGAPAQIRLEATADSGKHIKGSTPPAEDRDKEWGELCLDLL